MNETSTVDGASPAASPEGAVAGGSSSGRLERLEVAVLALVALLVHAGALRNGFTVDDSYLVVGNRALGELENIPSYFVQSWGGALESDFYARMNAGYYRPLTMTLQALEVAAFGRSPLVFHATSLVLHALASVLVLGIARRLLGRGAAFSGAFLTGLLFAVHPLHVEPIEPATYQSTLLAGTLALASFRMHLAAPRPGTVALGAALAWLAALAKEEAVIVPAWVFAHTFLVAHASGRLRAALRASAPYALAVVAYGAMRVSVVSGPGMSFFGDAPFEVRLYTMLSVAFLDLRLLVAPHPLCPFYDWYVVPFATSLAEPQVLLGLGVVLLVPLSVVALARRGEAMLAFAIAAVPLALLPVMQLVPILNVAAERFLFLPSFGACLAAGVLAARDRRGRAVAFVAVVAFAALSVRRHPDWRDDRTLNEAYARDFPETPTPHLNLADLAEARSDTDAALAALAAARTRDPSLAAGWVRAIRLLRALDRDPEALALAREAASHGIDRRRLASLFGEPRAPRPTSPRR